MLPLKRPGLVTPGADLSHMLPLKRPGLVIAEVQMLVAGCGETLSEH